MAVRTRRQQGDVPLAEELATSGPYGYIAWRQKHGLDLSVVKVSLPILLAGIACLFLWEGFQYSLDHVFGTHLFADAVQDIQTDFWEDIAGFSS